MLRAIPRSLGAALFGALVGPACLILLHAWNPSVVAEFDETLPPGASGFHAPERIGSDTIAWTGAQAAIAWGGLDRRVAWTCVARLRGARPPGGAQPEVVVAVDGVRAAARQADNEFRDLPFALPAAPSRRGVVITLSASTSFVPSADDPRELGVQLDRLACHPATPGILLPPRHAVARSAQSAGLFGAALGLAGITAGSAVIGAVLVAVGQAVPLASGNAVHGTYADLMPTVAFWVALAMLAVLMLAQRLNGARLRNTARFVVLFSGAVFYLKLIALAHPCTPIVDALYHAHRFEWVLDGRFYFTQLSKSGTPFPYAVALYLFAAPWALLTRDHVMLLRAVVCASEVAAGGLLYLMVVRSWGDRLAGAVAVALFTLVPIAYGVVGNANLTNAFGQSAALATMAAVVVCAGWNRRGISLWLIGVLATLALLSHVSVVGLLLTTLIVTIAVYHWFGDAHLRAAARLVALATGAALLVATVAYYGHFLDLYEPPLARIGAAIGLVSASPDEHPRQTPPEPAPELGRVVVGRTFLPLPTRLANAGVETVNSIGPAILLLALLGTIRTERTAWRSSLGLAVVAWGVAWVGFVGLAVFGAVETRYQKDAWEFIGRVELATYPAAVLLAARGAVWAWRAGAVWRVVSLVLLSGALATGVAMWAGWFRPSG